MKCVGLFYGGVNYTSPDPDRDLESFDSVSQAKRVFESRADYDPVFPCVESPELHIYWGTEYHENGPDLVITLGPRGGVRVDH